ncbi:MAG: CBU_0592 family membrane protein [Humibacter sp.]
MDIVIQIIGSLLVLAGFALAQWGVLDPKSVWYLVVNVVGSGILAVNAVFEGQWGFLLLEGVWAIVSLVSLIGVLRLKAKAR